MSQHSSLGSALRWVIAHWRRRADESGYYVAAKQMRKQGIPLQVALALLFA